MEILLENLKSIEESNHFLRALWAKINTKYGSCSWNFTPSRNTSSKVILLGHMNIKDDLIIEVSVRYKNKGNLVAINFHNIAECSKQDSELNNLRKLVKECQNYNSLINEYYCSKQYELVRGNFSSYQGNFFSIKPLSDNVFELVCKVKAYGKKDAGTIGAEKASQIVNILSVFSNGLILHNTESIICNNKTVEHNIYDRNHNWIDDRPLDNNNILISSKACELIDKVLSLSAYNENLLLLLGAFSHFHSARSQDALEFDSVIPSKTLHKCNDEYTFTFEEDTRFRVSKEIQRSATENASVLYISALEVISLIGAESAERCRECKQDRYSISARVQQYLKNNGCGSLVKTIKDYYNLRSRYLHQGQLIKNNTYTGTTVPVLDLNTQSHLNEYSQISVLNLREWCAYLLRQSLETAPSDMFG
ncbi:hypothetical protein [Aliivibrio sp. S10_S31]|uniref:hypothetical protein n=1 Tax=Aliivibrio sp. S10_S31 TaxID=2720224 RepID=UPI0016806F25|nr:hypothetical protein [Aliivibrio sp. S10_S31]MBD1571600.1 hypothetical protein [Aliivibrio sp. S10_S31]